MDTNVFIYAFEFPRSNARKIIELLNRNEIEAIISERVLREVISYFRKYYRKDLAAAFRYYLLLSCAVIPASEVRGEMSRFKGAIKDKDLEQLAVTKRLGLKDLVSYDKDFEPFEEYITPKRFIKTLGLDSEESEY